MGQTLYFCYRDSETQYATFSKVIEPNLATNSKVIEQYSATVSKVI
jgi:hypothetical protein